MHGMRRMKCIVLAEYLQKYFLTAERFTGKNIHLPILGNILFEFFDQKIKITATNLEIACVFYIPAKILKEGSVTIPARSFTSYLQTLPSDGKVILEEKDGVLYIETESVHSKIVTVSAKDFPLIPKIKKEKSIKIKTQDFQTILQKVATAVSVSKIKPELNGVFVSYTAQGNMCTFAATDTFRLAEEKIFIQKSNSGDFSFIIPIRTVQELIHYQTNEKDAELVYGDSQIKVLFGEQEIISNSASGTFPNYGGIIPKTFTTTVEIAKTAFIDAIRSASFFSSKLQDIRIKMESSEAVEINAENSEIGETTVSLKAKIQGKPAHISFNYKFLLDGVQALSGDSVVLSMNTEASPALLKSADNSMYQYLIMPIKGL